MAFINAQNDTFESLNVFIAGPDLAMAQSFGLPPGYIVTFQCQPFLDYALGAFSTTTGALVYLGKARPDTGIIPLVQNQFAVQAHAAQQVRPAAPGGSAKHKQRGSGANPTVHPDFSITVPVEISIVNGSGSQTLGPYPTGGAVITGTFTIAGPQGGTWSITATDENGVVVFSIANAVQGTTYPFGPYQSGPSTTVTISAQWSIHANANLEANVTLNL
jgi:hypothetical protein